MSSEYSHYHGYSCDSDSLETSAKKTIAARSDGLIMIYEIPKAIITALGAFSWQLGAGFLRSLELVSGQVLVDGQNIATLKPTKSS